MKIILANPRGFCAGVERAILIVEKALLKYGPPIYVKHEIVHNRFVVEDLKKKGVIFVEEITKIPKGAIVIFSAHGVSKLIYTESSEKKLIQIDATCPLVKKVHKSIERFDKKKIHTILIGHKNHPEVEGTMGQLKKDKITLVQTVKDVEKLNFSSQKQIAYTTQTTLSIYETKNIIDALKAKFPHIQGPSQGDICYATTNRQKAVLEMTDKIDLLIIIGSQNSSNSNRLRELGLSKKISSYLIDTYEDVKKEWFDKVQTVGFSSGASAPDHLLKDLIDWTQENFNVSAVEDHQENRENVFFKLPDVLLK